MHKKQPDMKETLKKIHSVLDPLYGRREADAIARLIFEYVKGWTPVDMIVKADTELSDFNKSEIDSILTRLKQHEPIQYILGYADFYGMRLKVNPSVLIPRPETAQLVDLIVDENKESDLRVLDICTGSGCIALALARNLRFPEITALDVSSEALAVARENAASLKCRVRFVEADVLEWMPQREEYNIVVANPPYICEKEKTGMDKNVLLHEPEVALFVPDDDPLLFYRRIAKVSRTGLTAAGKLYFEINPFYLAEIKAMLAVMGYVDIRAEKDMYGRDRFVIASNPGKDD